MSKNFNSCMENWVKMVNESTYNFNPDDDKTDQLFIDADKYEDLAKEIDEYYSKAEKTGKIEGNLNESDEEENKDGSEDGSEDGVKNEATSPEETMKKFDSKNKELAAAQEKVAKTVSRVDITDLYDGYVACEVTFKNGDTKEMEFEIGEEELNDMLSQLHENAPKKYADELTIDDAAIAVIRRRIDPSDALDWYYKPTNTSLDQWILDQEIERENAFTNYDRATSGWARQMGLFANDEGDFDDDNFRDWDDGSTDSYFRQ